MKIWGRDRIQQAGRLTRPTANQIVLLKPNEAVKTIVDDHPYTNLAMDYVFILGVAFLHSVLVEFKFSTTEVVLYKKSPNQEDIEEQVKE